MNRFYVVMFYVLLFKILLFYSKSSIELKDLLKCVINKCFEWLVVCSEIVGWRCL